MSAAPENSDNSAQAAVGKLALALSGGGSRAMAFHLGCLKALHGAGLLQQAEVISCVSGGSVIGAIYCSTPGDFAAFERRVREVLAQGFVWPALRIAVTTLEGLKAVTAALPLAIDRAAASLVRYPLKIVGLRPQWSWLEHSPLRRWASRTTILRRVFDEVFYGRTLRDLRRDRPKLLVVACELQGKSAFYFSDDIAGSWRLGSADCSRLKIAQAVAASASYPAALPAIDEYMDFEKAGVRSTRRVVLTDGGVYDNLGLAPLWPDRSAEVSLHVDKYDRIIACRAGYALEAAGPTAFWPSRMTAAFESVFARAQNLAMKRLFDLRDAGAISDFLLPYLGQDDSRLKCAPPDLVRREEAAGYPTDFHAMPVAWIDRLSRRGEQLTSALIEEYRWAGTKK